MEENKKITSQTYSENFEIEQVARQIAKKQKCLKELESKKGPSLFRILFSDFPDVDADMKIKHGNVCESHRIKYREIPQLKAELASLNVARKEREGLDPSQYTPSEEDASHQGREVITYDKVVKRYDSVDFPRILFAIRKEPFVRICRRHYRTCGGTPLGNDEWVNDEGTIFEYPYWFNDCLQEGSQNAENARTSIIKVSPYLTARLTGIVLGKAIEETLSYCKERLKVRIGSEPISQGKWGLYYLEKVEDLGTGRHVVKQTTVVFSPQRDFYYGMPRGPF